MTELSFPEHLHYTVEHEWLDDADPVAVGITAHAAEALGDIVYLDLPEVGRDVVVGEVIGEIESSKSVSELFSPVAGRIVEVNEAAIDDPALVNSAPYTDGWLVRIAVDATGELLTAQEYSAGL